MLSNKIQAAFNTQVGQEFSNSIAYIAIANYFKSENLNGLAKMFYKQAAEEHTHAMKFTEFLLDTGSAVKIPAIAAPQNEFASAARSLPVGRFTFYASRAIIYVQVILCTTTAPQAQLHTSGGIKHVEQ